MLPFLKRFINDIAFFVSFVIITVQTAGYFFYWEEGLTTIITIGLAGLITGKKAVEKQT